MTQDNNHSDSEPSRPPMGDLGPATETLAQVLAQLREITREAHTAEPLPEENYRPLEPRSLKQTRKPVRLHAPSKKRRWPMQVAMGGSLLVLAGVLALPVSKMMATSDADPSANGLQKLATQQFAREQFANQQFATNDMPAPGREPEVTKAVAESSIPAASPQVAEAVILPVALRPAVAAIQPEPSAVEQGVPLSTSSIRQQVVRLESNVALPPVDLPNTPAMSEFLPPASPEPPKAEAPPSPIREQIADMPAPAPIVPTAGMRVASLGEITIRPVSPAPSQTASPAPSQTASPAMSQTSAAASGLLARAQELIRNRDISSARLVLERALATGSAEAAFQLAETYDPQVLSAWQVRGIIGDASRARQLYTKASESGVKIAEERLRTLH